VTVVDIYTDQLGIPMVRLSGQVTERNGAELADRIMLKIRLHTEDTDRYTHPLSLSTACTRAPETWVQQTPVGD
jgi:hypothetical protein